MYEMSRSEAYPKFEGSEARGPSTWRTTRRFSVMDMRRIAANFRRMCSVQPRNGRRHLVAVILIGLGAAFIATVSFAESHAACGTFHTVKRGETLFKIAKQAYGDGWQYKRIFEANRDLLADEGSVEIGHQLLIPCIDSAGPGTRRAAPARGLLEAPAEASTASAGSVEEPNLPVGEPAQAPTASTPPTMARVSAASQDNSCARFHTVASGDTLFKITKKAYGDGWLYKKILEANRNLLPDESSIEIGYELLIPCLDGNGPVAHLEVMALREAPNPDAGAPIEIAERPIEAVEDTHQPISELMQQASQQVWRLIVSSNAFVDTSAIDASLLGAAGPPMTLRDGPPDSSNQGIARTRSAIQADDARNPEHESARYVAIKPDDLPDTVRVKPRSGEARLNLLTASNFGLYADKHLPAGGLITDLVMRAVSKSASHQSVRIAFVNDRRAHLDVLLPDGAFDVGFPWYQPDCSQAQRLEDDMRLLCAGFEFSRPFIEVPVSFYARADDAEAGAGDFSALRGKRLCRPKGHFMFDLDQVDLRAPHVSIERPETALECFDKLIQGQVDIVTLIQREAEEPISRLDIAEQIREIHELASAPTLHAVVPKTNSRGRQYLDLINQGLDQLMRSGEWFNVVASHNSLQLASRN